MRLTLLLFCLLPSLGQTVDLARTKINKNQEQKYTREWEGLSSDQVQELLLEFKGNVRKEYLFQLARAKSFIVNGRTDIAKKLLRNLPEKGTPSVLIKRYYQALIAFIEGDYELSLEFLDNRKFSDLKYYKNICPLKILLELMTDKSSNALSSLEKCKNLTESTARLQHRWWETAVNLKRKNPYYLAGGPIKSYFPYKDSLEETKLWLKLVLYQNKEELIEAELDALPQNYYTSQYVRELLGLIYYRLGNLEKSRELIEDLSTPNAENIKGNINLKNKEYELAFGHFKLALKVKKNSQNALERAIPLAWILGMWEDGYNMSFQIDELKDQKPEHKNKKLALKIAFLIRMNRFAEARGQLVRLRKIFAGQMPIEVLQMFAYVSLRTGRIQDAYKFSDKACRKFDGFSCWMQLQLKSWEDISKTIKRDERMFDQAEFSINDLKSRVAEEPIQEEVFIEQRDILELDLQKNIDL